MANQMQKQLPATRFAALASRLANWTGEKFRGIEPYVVIWWIFTGSVAASATGRALVDPAAPLAYFLAIAGTAGCAWMWLFSRALFRPRRPIEPWAIFAVGAVMSIESFWAVADLSFAAGRSGELYRLAENAASLICIAAIVMVYVETLSGVGPAMARRERRFRYSVVGVYSLIIVAALVGVAGASSETMAGQWKNAVLTACGLVAVFGSRAAIAFRRRFPMTQSNSMKKPARPKTRAAEIGPLARRIETAAANERLLATPGMKVAAFAAAIGEQDYKVTKCITGELGYRNFNQFINARRIDYAKRLLDDETCRDRSVASIAFDCGFNSIGPFNRAFRQKVGVTPSQYRQRQRLAAE